MIMRVSLILIICMFLLSCGGGKINLQPYYAEEPLPRSEALKNMDELNKWLERTTGIGKINDDKGLRLDHCWHVTPYNEITVKVEDVSMVPPFYKYGIFLKDMTSSGCTKFIGVRSEEKKDRLLRSLISLGAQPDHYSYRRDGTPK